MADLLLLRHLRLREHRCLQLTVHQRTTVLVPVVIAVLLLLDHLHLTQREEGVLAQLLFDWLDHVVAAAASAGSDVYV